MIVDEIFVDWFVAIVKNYTKTGCLVVIANISSIFTTAVCAVQKIFQIRHVYFHKKAIGKSICNDLW